VKIEFEQSKTAFRVRNDMFISDDEWEHLLDRTKSPFIDIRDSEKEIIERRRYGREDII